MSPCMIPSLWPRPHVAVPPGPAASEARGATEKLKTAAATSAARSVAGASEDTLRGRKPSTYHRHIAATTKDGEKPHFASQIRISCVLCIQSPQHFVSVLETAKLREIWPVICHLTFASYS